MQRNTIKQASVRTDEAQLKSAFPRLNWSHTIVIISVHALALFAFWYRPRMIDLALFVVFYLVTCFGIGIGYHRLLTHRGFMCSRWLRRVLTWMGAGALQGGPAWWVLMHRRHHQKTDQEGDPHSPLMGFFHGHMGWILRRDELDGKDHNSFVPDVSGNDPWMRILDKGQLYVMPCALTGLLCFAIAGWRGVLWGTIVRTISLWHTTWSINSICHLWGTRPNKTRDESGNVWWLGLLTLGEGWHNNHHARPASALHGWRWYEIDISGYVIRLMARLGLVWNVVRGPRPARLDPV